MLSAMATPCIRTASWAHGNRAMSVNSASAASAADATLEQANKKECIMSKIIKTAVLSIAILSGAAAAQAGNEVNDAIRAGSIVGTHGILGAQ